MCTADKSLISVLQLDPELAYQQNKLEDAIAIQRAEMQRLRREQAKVIRLRDPEFEARTTDIDRRMSMQSAELERLKRDLRALRKQQAAFLKERSSKDNTEESPEPLQKKKRVGAAVRALVDYGVVDSGSSSPSKSASRVMNKAAGELASTTAGGKSSWVR